MASEFSELGHIIPLPLGLIALCGLPLKRPSLGEEAPDSTAVLGPRSPEGYWVPTALRAAGVAGESGQGTNILTARASHDRNNISDFFIETTSPRVHLYIIIVMMANF